MPVHEGVGEGIDFHARVGFLESFVEEHHRPLIVGAALSENVVSHPNQKETKGPRLRRSAG